jgi:hypothetical protein
MDGCVVLYIGTGPSVVDLRHESCRMSKRFMEENGQNSLHSTITHCLCVIILFAYEDIYYTHEYFSKQLMSHSPSTICVKLILVIYDISDTGMVFLTYVVKLFHLSASLTH